MDLEIIKPSVNYFVLSLDTTDIDYQPRAMIYGSPRETFKKRVTALFESYYDQKVEDVEVEELHGHWNSLRCKVKLEDEAVMDHFVLLPGHQY